MPKICKVTLNKETFYANVGDLLLDGAIMSGVELQHDCRSGICGSCRVRLVDGKVFGGTEEGSDMIYACQARVVSDMKIITEPVPDTVSMSARVAELVRLAPDVVGVSLEMPKPLRYLPGQYCKVQFRGSEFPHPPPAGRTGVVRARPQDPHRPPRQGDRAAWQRFPEAQAYRPHRAGRERHRFRTDVVDRGRGDHGAAATGARVHCRSPQAPVVLHA